MKMSARGRKLLTEREGVRLKAYRDSVGVWTIGVGHTAAAGPPAPHEGMTITQAECDQLLSRDLVKYEQAIDRALKVPVAQHEYDALASICFNVGPKFAQSTCMQRLNAGDRKGAAEAIMMWSRPPEIIGRRRSEQKQFLTPYPKSNTTATAAGTVVVAGGAAAAKPAGDTWGGWGYVGAAVVTIVLVVAVVAFLRNRKDS